jgi:hypothetical protein
VIGKIKKTVQSLFGKLRILQASQDELKWAQVFHDTIRGHEFLEKLSLSPGRWAVGYPFLYVLTRIMMDYHPEKILEMGLGESSKLLRAFAINSHSKITHHILEHDPIWVKSFLNRQGHQDKPDIYVCPLSEKLINGHSYTSYENFEQHILPAYDLYVVDGPFGSKAFSRYDIMKATENLTAQDEFVIMLDDYNRIGEKQTGTALLNTLAERKIQCYHHKFSGEKDLLVIATEKYKWVCSL